MKLVIAATGASGMVYLQRLLDQIDCRQHEVHLVLSGYAKQVIADEIEKLRLPAGVREYPERTMNAPFASGSALFDAMVVVPCSMGTLARIASGTGETLILRAADVCLKERRKLILVPRETPWNLIHLRNMTQLAEAGAIILPAAPGFYHKPQCVGDLVDFIVARILQQLGIEQTLIPQWQHAED